MMQLKTIDGKQFYILPNVPVVKSMVLNGKLLPLPEIKKTLEAWNMKPVTFGHPNENGMQVSAAIESQLENHVGFITNSTLDDNRMRADLYLNKAKIDGSAEGQRLMAQVKAGKEVNVSTAYYDQATHEAGVHDGKAYDKVQREIAPDHLAILLDEKGACDCAAGCGINVNKTKENEMPTEKKPDESNDITINAELLADALASAMSTVLEKHLTANASLPEGTAQTLGDCKKMIKAMHDKMMAAPSATNAGKKGAAQSDDEDDEDDNEDSNSGAASEGGSDGDDEDYETQSAKKKKAKSKKKMSNNSEEEDSESAGITKHAVDYDKKNLQANANEQPVITTWAQSMSQKRGA